MSESTIISQQPPMSALQKFNTVIPYKGGGVKLTDVNPHLVCVLCHGYFVDATSIVECLHSFCRSCIILHLDKKSFCPICQEEIQNSKALKPDKALQDIVYKLVPGLFHSEMKRRQEFYQKHPHRDMHLHPESRGVSVDRIIYTADELISLSLEYYDKECEKEMWNNVTDDKGGLQYVMRSDKLQRCLVRKRYLKCPSAVRMSHLKKFIRMKYNLKPTDSVELLYRRESLPEEYSIMDIAYIYTWNRNEPMRFFYKINARVVIPIMPVVSKCITPLTDSATPEQLPKEQSVVKTTSLPPKLKMTVPLNIVNEMSDEDKKKSLPDLLKLNTTEESVEVKAENLTKIGLNNNEPMVPNIKNDLNKSNHRSTPTPPIVVSTVPLNPPISPEGTSRKENVSDNIRNSCANEPVKPNPTIVVTTEEKKSTDSIEQQQINATSDVPMKKLEKLVDQQQRTLPITVATTITTASTSPPSVLPLPKKTIGESKLNLSISKLIMKNQNASAATKFVPTLQQMQQIGMHTSIPTLQQQQQQILSPQPNAYVRPGFPGMLPFKRTQDVTPTRSQAPTNRPPFIPVRKSYEWNRARTLAAKPSPSPVVAALKDNKTNEKSSVKMAEKPTKKSSVEKSSTAVPNSYMLTKNSDEMNAAQSLLKVGQDLRLTKPPMITNLHDKYNCESSLQITKVTETETNKSSATNEKHSISSQPSLQIMRVPPATEKTTQPTTTEASNNNSGNTLPLTTKPVNKKPVPSLYSMPTKRMKEEQHHNGGAGIDNKRKERRVDTENGVLSVSLLTETSKQDMDAKRREIVQPDVSIKLMTFPTESGKKTSEMNCMVNGSNNKRKHDEHHSGSGNGAIKRKNDEPNSNGIPNKKKTDESNSIGKLHNKKKQEDSNPGGNGNSSANNKRNQDEPERKAPSQKPTPTKDDVPQLIEINTSPYAKLLPSKKSASKQSIIPKKHTSPKLQPPTSAKVLDLSKSPPNVNMKRSAHPDSPGNSSNPTPINKVKTTSPVQLAPSTIATSISTAAASINSNFLFAAQRQAAAFLLKQHFESFNNGLMHNGVKGPVEWPRAMFNPAMFRPPTNLNN